MAKLVLFMTIIVAAGCGYAPSVEENVASRQLVTNVVDAPILNQSQINLLLKAAQDDKKTNPGGIYQIEIEVVATSIANDARDPAGHGRIHLTARDPEDVAVAVDCYFADQDEAAVQALKPRQTIRLRGQLVGVYSSGLVFSGCVLLSE